MCRSPPLHLLLLLCSYTTNLLCRCRTPHSTTNHRSDCAVACQTPSIKCLFVPLPRFAYQALSAAYGNEAAAPLLPRFCCKTTQRVPWPVACATMYSCSATYLLNQVCSR